MKETGFRRMDNLGRVVVPSDMREKYDFNEKDKVDFIPKEEGILLKKVYEKCVFCDSKENLTIYNNKTICADCRKAIKL